METSSETDAQLLLAYCRNGSQAAFRRLVERYVGLVNSTAWRMTGAGSQLAQDVTQTVFTDLACKAATLPEGVVLGGWLHRHTCYTALKALRSENRRRARERTAMEIQSLNDEPGQSAHWLSIAPVLDAALNSLGEEDRNAILLRYYQQSDVRGVGLALGVSETAAQKRIGRALEKLRGLLVRSGVTVASAAALGTTLEASPVATSTPGLAASISAHALATTAATTTSTLTILKTMISTKFAIGLAAVVAAGVTTALVMQSGQSSHELPPNSATPSQVAQQPAIETTTARAQVVAPATPAAPAGGETVASNAPDANAGNASPIDTAQIQSGVLVQNANSTGASTRRGTLSFTASGNTVFTTSTAPTQADLPINKLQAAFAFANQADLGAPVLSVFNDDGSTTNTYTGPNGETIVMTQDANGRSRSMSVKSSPSGTPFGAAPSVQDNNDGTVTLTLPDGSTKTITMNDASGGGNVMISSGGVNTAATTTSSAVIISGNGTNAVMIATPQQ